MKDKEFLQWIHDRLILKHGEKQNIDYMNKLRCVINSYDSEKVTPNVITLWEGAK